jgi:6,7-dimethyl-8-ribityllumazine synthase
VSRFNADVTSGLLDGARLEFTERGVSPDRVETLYSPGAFEMPLIAKKLAKTGRYAGVVCLGCVIKGDTAHFEFISLGAAMGMMQASLETEVPVAFGVLTTYTQDQAVVRSRADAHNKGREAAAACVESAVVLAGISR